MWVVDSVSVDGEQMLKIELWSLVWDLVEKPKLCISIVCAFLKTLVAKKPARWQVLKLEVQFHPQIQKIFLLQFGYLWFLLVYIFKKVKMLILFILC